MAFIGNRCQWKGCGKSFSKLHDLIAHVEQTHVDATILQEEKGPSPRPDINVEEVCVPMSAICPTFPRISGDYQPVEKPTPEREERRPVLKVGGRLVGETRSRRDNSILLPITQRIETPVDHDYIRTSAAESSSEKPFSCLVSRCGKRFKLQSRMVNHMVTEHQVDPPLPPNSKIFKCTMCKKVFTSKRGFQEHCAKQHNSAIVSPQYSMQPQTLQTNSDGTQAIRSCLQLKKPPSPGNGTQATHSFLQPQTSQTGSDGTQAIHSCLQPKESPSPGSGAQATRSQSSSSGTQAIHYPLQPQTTQSSSDGTREQAVCYLLQTQTLQSTSDGTQALQVGTHLSDV